MRLLTPGAFGRPKLLAREGLSDRGMHFCHAVRAEKRSGTDRKGRTELRLLLDFLRHGDVLVVTRIDRLARSLKDLQDIVHELKANPCR